MMDGFQTRLARHFDELKWLYCELYHGDEAAFGQIYAQTRKTVYYIALSVVKERALAEDVMQNVYLSVLKSCAKGRTTRK